MITICCDFDGTMVYDGVSPLVWRPGAFETLQRFKQAGYRLVLHSCRTTALHEVRKTDDEVRREVEKFYATGEPPQDAVHTWHLYEEMVDFLKSAGAMALFDEIWTGPGKPLADRYIDDRSEAPDWGSLAREFGLAWVHGIRPGRAGAMGK